MLFPTVVIIVFYGYIPDRISPYVCPMGITTNCPASSIVSSGSSCFILTLFTDLLAAFSSNANQTRSEPNALNDVHLTKSTATIRDPFLILAENGSLIVAVLVAKSRQRLNRGGWNGG